MYLAVVQLFYSIHTTLRMLATLPVPSYYVFHNQFIVELPGSSLVPNLFCILTRCQKYVWVKHDFLLSREVQVLMFEMTVIN